ncbi:hypothetical protein [[Clostridium] colinum]|uniref:hypothetical protein n=1 Tax=[Clostridium] colinum TaxID=36835 RepID=UPI0020252974|nr:hypothetical protein [[Clostridium] colinum]
MRKKNKKQNKKTTVNQYINVADIKNNMLYTKDNYIIGFIKVGTVSISTMSKTDINILIKTLSSEFASVKDNLRMLKISKPVDISGLVSLYRNMYKNSNDLKQKELLREATLFLHKYSVNGNELENEYYFLIRENLNNFIELEKKMTNIARKFQSVKIQANICKTEEIARICNLFANSSYGNIETMELEDSLSIINMTYDEV